MKAGKRSDIYSITGETADPECSGDEQDIKVHRIRIDGSDPLALFVELLRKL